MPDPAPPVRVRVRPGWQGPRRVTLTADDQRALAAWRGRDALAAWRRRQAQRTLGFPTGRS